MQVFSTSFLDREPLVLSESGSFTLTVEGRGDQTGAYQFQIHAVPPTRVTPIHVDNVVVGSIDVPGEVDQFELEIVEGDVLFFDAQVGGPSAFNWSLRSPTGTQIFGGSYADQGHIPFDVSGTYTITLDGRGDQYGSYQFQVFQVPAPSVSRIPLRRPAAGELRIPGQFDYFVFEAAAGQTIFFDQQAGSVPALKWNVVDPTGTSLFSQSFFDQGPMTLSQSGQYTITVDGQGDATGPFTFVIWDVPPEVPQPIVLDTLVTGAVTVPGQTQSFQFAGSAGQEILFDLVFNQRTNVRYTLLTPSGSSLFTERTVDQSIAGLPETGTYTLVADGIADAVGSFSFQIVDGGTPQALPPAADLAVVRIDLPPRVIGDPAQIAVEWEVANNGPESVPAGTIITDLLTLSADDKSGAFSEDPFLVFLSTPLENALRPGESFVRRETLELFPGLDGELRLVVQTDIQNVVFEGDQAAEVTNNQLASDPVGVFTQARQVGGQPQLQLDVADGAKFPTGTTITLSGQARAIADAVNLIYIVDLSGSTGAVTGLDANLDGVVDELDNLNGDDRIGDILDAEIGAILQNTQQIAAQAQNTLVSIIAFGGRTIFVPTDGAEPLDLGPGLFNQSFRDPAADIDRDGTPDFEQAVRSMYFFSPGLGGFSGARRYRNVSIGSATDFGEAIREVAGLLDRAPAADQTQIFFLTDGIPSAADAIPTDEELAALAARGIAFRGFQISGDSVTDAVQRLAVQIDADPRSSGGTTLVRDPNDLGGAVIESVRMIGVTVNGRAVPSFDAGGNFFAPITLSLGENLFTLTAIDSQGRSTSRTITLIGVDPAVPDFDQFQDITSLTNVAFDGVTFNRQTQTLHAEMKLTNLGPDPLAGPVLVTFDSFAPAAVALANPETLDPLGRPTIVLDEELGVEGLAPGESSVAVPVALLNPDQLRFDFNITVRALGNTAPRFTTTPLTSTTVGTSYVYDADAVDAEAHPLAFRLATAPAGMDVDPATGIVTWTSNLDQVGRHQVQLVVEDAYGGVTTQVFQLDVQLDPPNRPPVFRSEPVFAANPGDDYEYAVNVWDADGDRLAFSLEQAPNGMSIDPGTGVVRFPNAAPGEHDVSIRVDDGQGGSATQSYRLSVGEGVANAGVPIIQSTPPTVAVVDALYLYLPLAQDADGDPLTFSLVAGPATMIIDAVTGRIDWTPDTTQIGTHAVALRVDDGRGGFATQLYSVDVTAGAVNRPPIITTVPSFVASQDEAYRYDMDALDPDGDRLSFAVLDGPSGMAIDAATGLVSFTPDVAQLGRHRVRLGAIDPAGATGFQSFDLDVRGPNTPPAFTSAPLTQATAGVTYRYRAAAEDRDDLISFHLLEAPPAMTLDTRTGSVLFTPTDADVGDHPVTIRATDQRGAVTDQTYVLTVVSDSEPPQVSLTLSRNLLSPGEMVAIRVTASDNVSIASLVLTVGGQRLDVDSLGFANFTATAPGLPDVVGTATDPSGNQATTVQKLRVIDPTDTSPPDVVITSPAPGAVVTYLTDIVGSVVATDLEFFRVDYARLDRIDLNDVAADDPNWIPIVDRDTAVSDGVLGVFDPTMLTNDNYVVRVMAQDFSGNINVQALTLSVEAQAKLGQFDVEFVDLSLPLAGIPIQVTRRYSTLNAAESGDFGFGWTLGVVEANIRETVPLGLEQQAGLFGATPFRAGTRVDPTNPDGKRVGFTFTPEPQGGLLGPTFVPAFTADNGVYDRLEVEPVALSQRDDGSFALFLFGLPYNPSSYQLVRPDGTAYRYDQFAGLQDVTDRNGNQLVFTSAGIFHSSGESIQFERDDLGRILRITDPAGNAIGYSYDGRGDLVRVTDQTGDEHSYTYFAEPAHYLDQITDPTGVAVRNEYDDSGRLVASTDAFGNPITLSYDLASNTEVIADRLGNESSIIYDFRGNIVSLTDPLGATVQITYDANDNETSVTDARGFTSTFGYDERGNLASATNALGETLTFTYNSFGDVSTARRAGSRDSVRLRLGGEPVGIGQPPGRSQLPRLR